MAVCPLTAFSQEITGSFTDFIKNNISKGGLLTGENGLGEKHTFDFGSAMLVSCRGAVDNQSVILTGLHVKINDGWQLKRPAIRPTQSPLWSEEKIFYPLRTEEMQSRTESYQDMVFFPMIYTLTDSTQPFFVEKEIELTACQDQDCQTASAEYSLFLEAGKGYPTDICAALTDDLSRSTLPLPENVTVSARLSANNQVQLVVNYPQKVKSFFIQIDNDFTYTIQKNTTRGKRAEIIFTPDKRLSPTDTLNLKLLAPQGWYDTQVQVRQEPFILEQSTVSFWAGLKSGLIFFFFSAFYLLFWSLRVKNQDELSNAVQKIYQYAFLFSLILGCCLYFGVPLGLFFSRPLVLGLQFTVVGYLLFKPVIKQPFVPLLLIAMPQPFVQDILLSFPDHTFSAFALSYWWGFCCFFLFGITRYAAPMFQAFQERSAQKQVALLIRLPLILISLWVGGVFACSFFEETPAYSKEALQEALNNQQTVLLMVQNGPCLTCALNLISGQHLYPATDFIKRKELVLMKVYQQSEAGKKLLQTYQMKPESSFYLLFSPSHQEGLRLPNTYFETNDWVNYLKEVGLEKNQTDDL